MYILGTMYYLYKSEKRATFLDISKRISKKHNTSRIKVMLDMIWCSVRHGAMWTEYNDLDFYLRSGKNRATFITTFYNFKLYNILNEKNYRNIFHEKILFLESFKDFIKREWIKIDGKSDEEIKNFLLSHKNIVAKASYGDSGQQIEVLHLSEDDDLNKTVDYIRQRKLNLLEEQIYNCDEIKKLNPTSLNTLRIVSVVQNGCVNILFAGIRVGSRDAEIDNISQGGKVARIDISSGKIDSVFYVKSSSCDFSLSSGGDDAIGFQIPLWNEVIETVRSAALKIPQIRFVAWDVAITPNSIELVEGNESFGSVIMQLTYSETENGLKPELVKILNDGKKK